VYLTKTFHDGLSSYCLSAAPVIQISYSSKMDWSNGSVGLTGMNLVSSTFRHTSSRYQRNTLSHGRQRTIGSSTLFEVKNHDLSINDFNILGNVDSSKGIITSDHNTLLISSPLRQRQDRRTLWEESASIFKVSTASGLRGQWKTKNPANSSLHSTSSLEVVLIYHQHSFSVMGLPLTDPSS